MINRLMAAASAVFAGVSILLGCSPKSAPSKTYSAEECINQVKDIDATLSKDNGDATIDLAVLVDREFIKRYSSKETWWEHFCSEMDFVDKNFNDRFGIDFDVDAVSYLELPEGCPDDLIFFISWLSLRYKPGQFDAFVYLSGRDCSGYLGITEMLGNFVVATPNKIAPLRRVLQHEFSHLYGAEDVRCSSTILSNDLKEFSYSWSSKEEDIISRNKNRHWRADAMWYFDILKKNIDGFPEKDREDVTKLVCYNKCRGFYPESLDLAAKLRKKYPKNELIEGCYIELLEMK